MMSSLEDMTHSTFYWELYSFIATGSKDLLWHCVFEVGALSLLVRTLLCWGQELMELVGAVFQNAFKFLKHPSLHY